MGTPAYIQVEGSDVAVYKNQDGNPAGTLPWLRKFHAQFLKERGYNDFAYETAQLIRSSYLMAEEFGLSDSTSTGWGVYVMPNLAEEQDGEYNYILHKDGSISVNGYKYLPNEEVVFDNGTSC